MAYPVPTTSVPVYRPAGAAQPPVYAGSVPIYHGARPGFGAFDNEAWGLLILMSVTAAVPGALVGSLLMKNRWKGAAVGAALAPVAAYGLLKYRMANR